MRQRTIAIWLAVGGLALLSGSFGASAADTKKPAAVAASEAGSGGAATKAKPAAVQASLPKGSPTFATHLEILEAQVPLTTRQDSSGIYDAAHNLSEVRITVRGQGVTTEIAGSAATGPNSPLDYDGLTAFQILLEQGYFVFRENVGFIPTEKGRQLLGIRDTSGDDGGDRDKKTGPGLLGAKGGPDISSKKTDMVEPTAGEGVAQDPSQSGTFGGLLGADWTVNEDCMARRSKMYSDCVERCKKAELSSEEFGKCTEKCGKDSHAAYGDCEGAAPRTRDDQWK